jgi:hypothetical protein
MPDSAYDAFIDDCLQERASLIGLIEAMESKALAPGMPLVIPDGMNGTVASTLAAFKQTVAQLNALIDAYEATPEAPKDPDAPPT